MKNIKEEQIPVETNNVESFDMFPPPNKINRDGLISKIIENGDTLAYDSLALSFLHDNKPGEFLPYSLFVANKWSWPTAEFDVYKELIFLYRCAGSKLEDQMDNKSKKMAIEYLKLAAKHGHKQANEVIRDYFPELLVAKKK